jgi:serine phosphatase RsbU (regulator of sigma subunit)
VELSLQSGDALTWTLWLANASLEAGSSTLIFRSDVDGEIWRKTYNPDAIEAKDEIKISKSARYRLTLRSDGKRGRLADLSAWPKLNSADRQPFPLPEVRRLAEKYSAGDKYTVEFEFLLPDSITYQRLLALDIPRDLVQMWTITSDGDSLAATSKVSRWIGETGQLSFVGGKTKGGSRISLKLDLEMPEDGEGTLHLAPGARPPAWLPNKARMATAHKHDPWGAVIVPPLRVLLDTLAARAPEAPQATYKAQSLRIRGIDTVNVARLTRVFAERDSLAAVRRERLLAASGYDTLFLIGQQAFLPPDMHLAITNSLAGEQVRGKNPAQTNVRWFVESRGGESAKTRLFAWSYDEARIAYKPVPDEWFWDGNVLLLRPTLEIFPAVHSDHPATITLQMRYMLRSRTFEKNGVRYLDKSQRVWGAYLENMTEDTLLLVYHQSRGVERTALSRFTRLPKWVRYSMMVLAVFGLGGVAALFELRRREQKRKRMVAEMDAELEKARQVQLKLLPSGPMTVRGVEVLGLHQSMQSVGGDYYDFFSLDNECVVVCVADVAGHGLHAALLMSNLQATLHAVAQPGRGLTEIVSLLNREMFRRTAPEQFVTMLLCEVCADRKTVTACNAGHNPGYIIRKTGEVIEMDAGGIMLGMMDMWPFIQMEYTIGPGDLIVLYTDGIPEAEIGFEDMFGYERLKYFLSEHQFDRLIDIAQRLFRQVTPKDASAIADDMAIVLMRVTE